MTECWIVELDEDELSEEEEHDDEEEWAANEIQSPGRQWMVAKLEKELTEGSDLLFEYDHLVFNLTFTTFTS